MYFFASRAGKKKREDRGNTNRQRLHKDTQREREREDVCAESREKERENSNFLKNPSHAAMMAKERRERKKNTVRARSLTMAKSFSSTRARKRSSRASSRLLFASFSSSEVLMVIYRFFDVKIGRKKNKYRARFFFKASARLLLSRKKSQPPRAHQHRVFIRHTKKKRKETRNAKKREA